LCNCLRKRRVASSDTDVCAIDPDFCHKRAQVLLGECFVAEKLTAQDARERVDL